MMKKVAPIRIAIADDQTIVREGLKRILVDAHDIEIVGEAVNGVEALALARNGGFDILVLDLSMPGRSGLELIAQIKDEAPKLPVLVLTIYGEEQYAERAIRAGARGFLTKENAGTQLLVAIRKMASGKPYVSMDFSEQLVMDAMSSGEVMRHKQLSNREFEVFSLLAGGKSFTQIGVIMHISAKTVSTHKTHVLNKLGVHSIAEMVQYAVTYRLLPPNSNCGEY